MNDNQQIRIDKFLWAIRIYKTRSQASEACRKGRIAVNDNLARPSKSIYVNDIIIVRKPPVTYTYKVIHPI
jgi:ribosome-associated heat shock protein Hsp15